MKAIFLLKLLISRCELCRFSIEEQSEECAFSGRSDFSRNGRGKNREKMNSERKKEEKRELSEMNHKIFMNIISENSCIINGNSC
jgi:hypothetical protein